MNLRYADRGKNSQLSVLSVARQAHRVRAIGAVVRHLERAAAGSLLGKTERYANGATLARLQGGSGNVVAHLEVTRAHHVANAQRLVARF